ncbi:MAG: IS1380 family transposase [Candidatus Sericytochromatia bacterium]|nr:IS1380 family transposase [Candidatus Sericytochromatia bacterium]
MSKHTEQLPLWATRRQEVGAIFDADHTTSDAGVSLLSLVDRRLGLTAAMASVIQDRRNPLYVVHPMAELLRQRIYQIALGWEDCNDATTLRHDPVYKLAVGRQPVSGDDLASQPTLSRLENAVSEADLMRLWDLLIDVYLARQSKRRRRIVIDADGTNAETHGNQQLALFNGLYDQTCYMPLLIFCGTDQSLLGAILRPGVAGQADELLPFLIRFLPKLRAKWPKVQILIRCDAGFSSPELYDWCEGNGVDYIVGITPNKRLAALSAETLAAAQLGLKVVGVPHRICGKGAYKADSWPHARKVIWKVEVNEHRSNVRYVMTNLPGLPITLYERYCQRGASENWIKAFKSALNGDRMSCHSAMANCFRLMLHAAAYVLMHALREMLAGTEAAAWQFDTLRLRLLKVAGWVRQTVRKITLHLASSHPHQDLWALLTQRLSPT